MAGEEVCRHDLRSSRRPPSATHYVPAPATSGTVPHLRHLGRHEQPVRMYVNAFLAAGFTALSDHPRRGRPPVVTTTRASRRGALPGPSRLRRQCRRRVRSLRPHRAAPSLRNPAQSRGTLRRGGGLGPHPPGGEDDGGTVGQDGASAAVRGRFEQLRAPPRRGGQEGGGHLG